MIINMRQRLNKLELNQEWAHGQNLSEKRNNFHNFLPFCCLTNVFNYSFKINLMSIMAEGSLAACSLLHLKRDEEDE